MLNIDDEYMSISTYDEPRRISSYSNVEEVKNLVKRYQKEETISNGTSSSGEKSMWTTNLDE